MIEGLSFIRYCHLNKSVQIENARLQLLFLFLSLTAVTFLGFQFVSSQAYLGQSEKPIGKVFFWADDWSDERSAALANLADSRKSFCQNPAQYEYCADDACTQHFRDLRCLDICVDGMDEACIENSERWVMEESSMFFPTYFNETLVQRSASGQRTVRNAQWFLKGVEKMSIGFSHEYHVERRDGHVDRGSSQPGVDDKRGVLTILQRPDGSEVKRWQPGESLALKVETILELSGVSLDSVNRDLGKNFAPRAQTVDGLLSRISGLEAVVTSNYRNSAYHSVDWDGPVCFLTIHVTQQWTPRPEVQVLDPFGSIRFRYHYGLRVRFTTTGSFGWIDQDTLIMDLLSTATQAIVFIGVAKNVVYLIAIHLLGHLSQVYKKYVVQVVSLGEECSGLGARFVSYSETFKTIKDKKVGITEKRMFARFLKIFANDDAIDNNEVMRLVKFMFHGLHELHPDDPDNCQTINISEYAQACSRNEALTFHLMAGLLDADRERIMLERVFRDDSLKRLFEADSYVPEAYISERSKSVHRQKLMRKQKTSTEQQKDSTASPNSKMRSAVNGVISANRLSNASSEKLTRPLKEVLKEGDEFCLGLSDADVQNIIQEDDDVYASMEKLISQCEGIHMEIRNIRQELNSIKSKMKWDSALEYVADEPPLRQSKRHLTRQAAPHEADKRLWPLQTAPPEAKLQQEDQKACAPAPVPPLPLSSTHEGDHPAAGSASSHHSAPVALPSCTSLCAPPASSNTNLADVRVSLVQ